MEEELKKEVDNLTMEELADAKIEMDDMMDEIDELLETCDNISGS